MTTKNYPAYTLNRPDGSTIDNAPTGTKSKHRLRSFRRAAQKLGISGVYVAKNGTRVWTFIKFAEPKPGKAKAKLESKHLALVPPEEAN